MQWQNSRRIGIPIGLSLLVGSLLVFTGMRWFHPAGYRSGDTVLKSPGRTLRGHTSWIGGLVFLPDSKVLVSAGGTGDNRVLFWDTKSGKILRTIPQHSGVWCLSVSRDGRLMAVGFRDETIKLWNLQSHTFLRTLHAAVGLSGYVLAFTPDGKTLIAGREGTSLWDVNTGKMVQELRSSGSPLALSFDGHTLAAHHSRPESIELWDTTTWSKKTTLGGYQTVITSVAFSSDSRSVVTGSFDGAARLWDAANGKLIHTLEHEGLVQAVTFTPDGRRVVTASQFSCYVWDRATGKKLGAIKPKGKSPILLFAITPDGKSLAIAGGYKNGWIELWDLSKYMG